MSFRNESCWRYGAALASPLQFHVAIESDGHVFLVLVGVVVCGDDVVVSEDWAAGVRASFRLQISVFTCVKPAFRVDMMELFLLSTPALSATNPV